MPVYPDKIYAMAADPRSAGSIADADATGISASFTCGSFVRFYLDIDASELSISDIKFQSDGCGYAVAAASIIADAVKGKRLADLHGLEDAAASIEMNEAPHQRRQCGEIALSAMRSALDMYRRHRVEEFTGEKPLICSCFGVSEDTVENAIARGAASVTDVSRVTNAGSGCGSCRMLIQELIDAHGHGA